MKIHFPRILPITTFTKSSITNGEVSVIGIKADDSLVRKYNKKATFSNKNIPQLKENTAIHPMVKNLFPNVKVSNFPLAGRLQYLVKHCGQLAAQNFRMGVWSKKGLRFGNISGKFST